MLSQILREVWELSAVLMLSAHGEGELEQGHRRLACAAAVPQASEGVLGMSVTCVAMLGYRACSLRLAAGPGEWEQQERRRRRILLFG